MYKQKIILEINIRKFKTYKIKHNIQSSHFFFFNNKANKIIKNEEILHEQNLKIAGFYKTKFCNKTFLDLFMNSIFNNLKNIISGIFTTIKPFIFKYQEYLKITIITSFIFTKIVLIGLKINIKLYSLDQLYLAYSLKYGEIKKVYFINDF